MINPLLFHRTIKITSESIVLYQEFILFRDNLGEKKEKEEKFVKIGTPIIREFRHMRAIPRRNLHVHVCTLMRVRGTSCFSSKHPRNLVQKHQRRAAG